MSSTTNQYETDMSNMKLQFQNDFNTWFDTVKNTLGSDVAGNLLNQINILAGDGRTTETVKGNADNIKSLQQDLSSHSAEKATLADLGHVMPDNITTFTNSNGVISTRINPLTNPLFGLTW